MNVTSVPNGSQWVSCVVTYYSEMCCALQKGWLFIKKGLNRQTEAEENVGSTQFTVAEIPVTYKLLYGQKNKTTKTQGEGRQTI